MTIEINTDNQDVNSANSPTVQNIRQNTDTTNMVSGGDSSQPGAHEPSLQLAGQNNSISPSQSNEQIQRTGTPQITEPVHGTETQQIKGPIHGTEIPHITGSVNGTEIQETTVAIHETENLQRTGSICNTR